MSHTGQKCLQDMERRRAGDASTSALCAQNLRTWSVDHHCVIERSIVGLRDGKVLKVRQLIFQLSIQQFSKRNDKQSVRATRASCLRFLRTKAADSGEALRPHSHSSRALPSSLSLHFVFHLCFPVTAQLILNLFILAFVLTFLPLPACVLPLHSSGPVSYHR